MKALILMALIIGITGCRPEEAATEFNEVIISDVEGIDGGAPSSATEEPREKVLPPEVVSVCTEIKEEQACIDAPDCQPLKNEDSSELVSCIETPIQRPPGGGGGEETSGGGETTEANYACQKADAESDEESDEKNQKDKNKKVAVCHVPKGNPANLHTICISINGWENGHKDRHGVEESRDHLGACTQRELDVIGEEV